MQIKLTFPSARHFQSAVEIVYKTLRRQPSPSSSCPLLVISIAISNCARLLNAIYPTFGLRLSSYLLFILFIDLAIVVIADGGSFGSPQAVCAILRS